jgi:hypothetical protein
MLLWHGTDREFDAPKPLTHLGSRSAAEAAPGFRGVLMAFDVCVQRPLRVEDTPGGDDLWRWLRSAADGGVVSEDDFLAWERQPTGEALVRLLETKGYDGLVYENRWEDRGGDSWVVFHPAQATRRPDAEDRSAPTP